MRHRGLMTFRLRSSDSLFGVVVVAVALLSMSVAREARAQEVVISEFLTVNDGVLLDADRDDPDWIEIRNRGEAIDLDVSRTVSIRRRPGIRGRPDAKGIATRTLPE